MKKAILILTIVILAALLSGAAPAREAMGDGKQLSLEEALELALASSPALHASRMNLEAAGASRREITASRLPAFRLGGGYTRLSEVPPFEVTLPIPLPPDVPSSFVVSPVFFNSYSLRLSVEQPLFTGFRLESAAASARHLEAASSGRYRQDESDLVFEVKRAYWNLVSAGRTAAAVEESKKTVEEHLKDVRAFREQGLLTAAEVLKAEVRLANVDLQLIEAGNAAVEAGILLNSLTGLPLEIPIEPTTLPESTINAVGPEPETEQEGESGAGAAGALRADLSGHPELTSLRFRIKSAEAGLKAARSGYFPQVFLSANYYYLRPNPRLMPSSDEFYGTWDAGVSVSLDLWNWGRTKQQVKQAQSQLARANDAARLAEDRIRVEITRSRLAMKSARARMDLAAKTVLMAEENLRVAREKFKQGLALNSDVLDAQTELFQARLSRTRAEMEAALAAASYEKALGR